jgi:ubiquinone/menaquinone biosynthesis C-methylase UbiE
VGNGFDTCFLSETVGPSGQVIGFDIQQAALDATRKRLEARQLLNVRLLLQGHQTMSSLIWQKRPDAIMFNLGFLPRSDHQVVTEPETSAAAIQQAVELLQEGGILTVLAYRGHAGGPEEFAAVEQVLQQCAETYQLQRFDSSAPKSTSPVLFILKKTPKS